MRLALDITGRPMMRNCNIAWFLLPVFMTSLTDMKLLIQKMSGGFYDFQLLSLIGLY